VLVEDHSTAAEHLAGAKIDTIRLISGRLLLIDAQRRAGRPAGDQPAGGQPEPVDRGAADVGGPRQYRWLMGPLRF
jgi:hypothetical protein